MKYIFIVTGLLFSLNANANGIPEFSAFSLGDELYVTILMDSCNQTVPYLEVAESCREDRETKNSALICSANFSYASTKMACNNPKKVARVLTVSLSESNVASEAKLLALTVKGESVIIPLNRL